MSFRVRIDPVAPRHMDEFAEYLRNYTEDFAVEQIERLIATVTALYDGFRCTRLGSMRLLETTIRAMQMGRVNRRGPALPGLR
jgi:hypothetical protein